MLTEEQQQKAFNDWVISRAEKHFDEGEKQNLYPTDCPEYEAYEKRWKELEKESKR